MRYVAMLGMFLASLLGCAPAQAVEVKDILAHERQSLAKLCKTIEFHPGFIDVTDLNGDGREDAIIDYQYLQCDGSNSSFCGTGGCTLRLYSGEQNGNYSEAGEFLSQGLKTRGRGQKTRLLISVHGGECGKAGVEPCTITGRLGRGKFIVESKR